jgi:micrococcal nuclease
MKHRTLTLATLASFAIVMASAVYPAQAAGRRPSDLLAIAKEVAYVSNVIDGDTIQVEMNGVTYTVRYIGIDAPALNECYGVQARNANAALVQGQTVRMENDVNDYDPTATYLLRYVYLLNGTMANEALVLSGNARAVMSEPNIKNQGSINGYEAQARTARRGGWGACGWKSSVAQVQGGCVTIPAEVMAQPVFRPPQIAMLKNGDCVNVYKASNPEGPAWSGLYIYHPARTIVKLTSMYVRWKDAVVLIQIDQNGTPMAHVVRDTYRKPQLPWETPGEDPYPGSRRVSMQALERDPGRTEMLQIPNPRTWLLRDVGNGNYEALVDVFEYKSGDMRPIYYAASAFLH